MVTFPNSKINLGLHIIRKQTDGFHDIESCFYPIGRNDVLEIIPSDTFSFRCSGITIPGNWKENICVKAYENLARDYGLPPVAIYLLKTVPIGAGLGGGSADAAFTIKALNDLFDLQISVEKQITYARKLGSDCAFFIKNRPMYCFGRGDQFEDIERSLSGMHLVLVNPGIHIPTADAYRGVTPSLPVSDLKSVLSGSIDDWVHLLKNDFEVSIFPKYPILKELKEALYRNGAKYAAMTGSGSTIFGIFENEVDLGDIPSGCDIWSGTLT